MFINRLALSAFVLASLSVNAQDNCECSLYRTLSKTKNTNLRDSISVFRMSSKLQSSKEQACVFQALNNKCHYYISQKQPSRVQFLIQEQEKLVQDSPCKTEFIAEITLNKARYYHLTNNFESLQHYALEALKISEKLDRKHIKIEALKELVFLYTRMDEDDKAWNHAKHAERLILSNNKHQSTSNYRWLGYQYEQKYTLTNRKTLIDSGLSYIEKAKNTVIKTRDFYELTQIYRALEAFSYHKGELAQGLIYIDTAIYFGKKLKGSKNLSGLYLSKAWNHYDLREFNEVEKWTDTMLYVDNKKDIAGFMMTLLQASELYEGSGNLKKAYHSYKSYSKLKDSLISTERLKAINDLETKYQTEIKDNKIKRLTTLLTIASLGIVSLLLIGTLLRLRQSKKQNKALRIAFEKQIQLEKELTDVRDEIAQDFHDDLGNKLARISLLSNLVNGEISIDDPKVKSKIRQITEDANGLYRGTRDFVFSLKSNSDRIEEIATYISDFGEDFFEKTKVKFVVKKDISVNAKLPHYWNKQLVFIFKEALTNALKHSKCDSVLLSFVYKNKELTIDCSDNGIGISNEDMVSSNGLLNMKNRAEKIGGQFHIDSQIGKGTTIRFTGHIKKNEI
ncbi:sensor histidine kinase [Psychroserpens luteolus]|uniref:sensor histidine kinase n=1 Tax=Psychroserpens luteolus TaxID=2855840 RepID=UPI001E2CB450|nr:ATP-binding protein [Psychroserpens luteolus]MCD2259225.1 hypothetical protein [Psychroserpens luteolus]